MKTQSASVPIDYFGVAASQHLRVLLTTDSNRRARKSAFNALGRLARIAGLIPVGASVSHIAIFIDLNGYQGIRYEYECKDKLATATTGSDGFEPWSSKTPAGKAP